MELRKPVDEYRTVIVDMDGTLYFQPPVRLCMAFAMLCHFWRLPDFFIIKSFREMAEKGIAEEDRFKALPPRAPEVIDEWMQKRPLPFIRRFRDKKLLSLLDRLKKNGAAIVLYSDHPVTDKARYVGIGADHMFYSGDSEIGCMKPSPKGLLYILKLTDTVPEDALFIGDRYSKDGKCAENAGIDYIILGRSPHKRKHFYAEHMRG